MAVHLLCLPRESAQRILQDASLSPEDKAAAVFHMRADWPKEGELVVKVNDADDPRSAAWFPDQLVSIKNHTVNGMTVQRIYYNLFVGFVDHSSQYRFIYQTREEHTSAHSPLTTTGPYVCTPCSRALRRREGSPLAHHRVVSLPDETIFSSSEDP